MGNAYYRNTYSRASYKDACHIQLRSLQLRTTATVVDGFAGLFPATLYSTGLGISIPRDIWAGRGEARHLRGTIFPLGLDSLIPRLGETL